MCKKSRNVRFSFKTNRRVLKMSNLSDWYSRHRYVLSLFLVMSLGSICLAEDLLVANKSKPGKPKYRVLFNKDLTDFFEIGGNTPQEVRQMVDEVADGGADVFLVNPNAQVTNYPSKAWQTVWDGYKKGRRAFFGDVPDALTEWTGA